MPLLTLRINQFIIDKRNEKGHDINEIVVDISLVEIKYYCLWQVNLKVVIKQLHICRSMIKVEFENGIM